MTRLSDFSKEDAALLVSLPYKIGMWVSYADDTEGESDDELEEKALKQCIAGVARIHEDKPFIKEVAAETLRLQERWPVWADQSFNAPKQAGQAVHILSNQASEETLKNYGALLMEIATTVAQASGEFDQFDDYGEAESGFGALIGKITGAFSGMSQDDPGHPMNVSAAEDSALSQLASILRGESA